MILKSLKSLKFIFSQQGRQATTIIITKLFIFQVINGFSAATMQQRFKTFNQYKGVQSKMDKKKTNVATILFQPWSRCQREGVH